MGKYQPSTEEGYNIAKSERGSERSEEKYPGGSYEIITPEKPYHEETTVNGVEIVVAWYDDSEDYEIYFPQIEFGEVASEKGVSDQVIRVSQRPEVAKQVFDYATRLAQTESDVYEIYKKVEEFARYLPYDVEE